MRNEIEYPVTVEEVLEEIATVNREYMNQRPMPIGGMRGVLLSYAYDFILEYHEQFTKYIEKKGL